MPNKNKSSRNSFQVDYNINCVLISQLINKNFSSNYANHIVCIGIFFECIKLSSVATFLWYGILINFGDPSSFSFLPERLKGLFFESGFHRKTMILRIASLRRYRRFLDQLILMVFEERIFVSHTAFVCTRAK